MLAKISENKLPSDNYIF